MINCINQDRPLRITLLPLKPQIEHTPEELAKIQVIPPGVTSGSQYHQWGQYLEGWLEAVENPLEFLR